MCADAYEIERHVTSHADMAAEGPGERRYDLIVFGSTGFTGKFVAEEVYRLQNEGGRSLKWAAAGRNEEKVKTCLEGACM